MPDRLHQLLEEHGVLYGVICRDTTLTDLELYRQAGYHILWIDLEHGSLPVGEAVRLCRSIVHMGMIPLARIAEPRKDLVFPLLDGGFQILVLPDAREPSQVAELIRLGKFPPLGERGVSSTSASVGFALGSDPQSVLREANKATHFMVQLESDQGLANLNAILQVEGVDMVTVGPLDWSVSQGLLGDGAKSELADRVDRVLVAARQAGKLTAGVVGDVQQARNYLELGVRLLFLGVDVALKRRAFAETLARFQQALSGAQHS